MSETATRTPAEVLSALEVFYQEFCDKTNALEGKSGIRDAVSNFFGTGPRKKAQGALVSEAVEVLRGHVAALLTAAESCTPEERSRWALSALERILLWPGTENSTLNLMLNALEGQAQPLLAAVDGAALADLAQRYQKRNPKRMMLPNQRKLLDEMEKLARR